MFFRRKKKKGQEQRKHYRRAPGKKHALGVLLTKADGKGSSGEVVDLSAGGAALRFAGARDPQLPVDAEVELTFSSLVHPGEITAKAKVASIGGTIAEGRRYGLEFTDVQELFHQLDAFYLKFFNRRRAFRVRPALDSKLPLIVFGSSYELPIQVNDISGFGLGFVVTPEEAVELRKENNVNVAFSVPKSSTQVRCPAKVRHSTQYAKGVLFGLEFVLEDERELKSSLGVLRDYVSGREQEMARWDSAYDG